ncbi:unnamed protein product [Phyllotreta striolata]|uniref:F-box domain-containing protein n=1 Tax=Phyllotreta striolata TaxID=444603 RepID=A0A9N9TD31_PHYSR|nr:unnamed protein product [Phyllotreta striolata]
MDRYISEEKALIREAIEEKKRFALLKLEKARHFKQRCLSIQEYFRRLACYNKIPCIMEFVGRLKSPTIKFQVVSSLPLQQCKIECYWAVDPRTEDPYQKMIWDHDRTFDETTLIETLRNDLQWFDGISDDHQYHLMMQLLSLCSSSVRRMLYPRFRKELRENWTKLMAYREERMSVFETKEMALDSVYVDHTEEVEYDPKHPATIELMKQRKKWADTMNDYKKEVMAPPLKAENRSKSSGKSTKTNSSIRSTITDCDIDLIQLLPIWIVKNILSYFSNIELTNFSLVNNYWHYVCEDIIKERKAREKLTLTLEALREKINPKIFQKLASQESTEAKGQVKRQKDHPHYAYAAVDKRLVPEKLKNLCNHTIFHEDQYATNDGRFEPFPRVIKAKAELPKTQPCVLQDIGVKFHIDEDMEEQQSFVTYPLSSSRSEIIHGVDDLTLNEW